MQRPRGIAGREPSWERVAEWQSKVYRQTSSRISPLTINRGSQRADVNAELHEACRTALYTHGNDLRPHHV